MLAMLEVQFGILQIGNHVGLHIDFVCPNSACASELHSELLIKAEAAKLLSTLGFDTEGITEMGELNINVTEADE